MDVDVEPEYLLWAMIEGQNGLDLHGILLAHAPGHENMLVYEVLCGAKGKFKFKPWAGEPKCEICEHKRKSLGIQA